MSLITRERNLRRNWRRDSINKHTVGVFFHDKYFESTFTEAELEDFSMDVLQIILRIRKEGEEIKQELFKKIESDFNILSKTI